MYELSGYFVNGDRYYNNFNSKWELEYEIKKIDSNGACRFPDTIIGTRDFEKLPHYLKKYIQKNDIKYECK